MRSDGRRYDASLRPNQLFAISLPESRLDGPQARSVVTTCERELLTPVGLRSLAPCDSRYVGRYEGGPRERDGAYHRAPYGRGCWDRLRSRIFGSMGTGLAR